jgi:hypothetical protein
MEAQRKRELYDNLCDKLDKYFKNSKLTDKIYYKDDSA